MLKRWSVLPFVLALIAAARVFFQSRTDMAVEVLALRQQVAVLKRRRPRAPLRPVDRLLWTDWRWKSRPGGGRSRISEEIRVLIRRLAQENFGCGAPKIHGELLKLGFVLSERTVARYLRRIQRRGDPAKRWLAFLRNHREAIVALDLFTAPTATFRVLYCLFIIEHGRRPILHFNVTRHPSADWVVQQLRETFAEAAPYRYAIVDRDSIFNADVLAFLQATGLQPKRTSIQAPWQNGTAERWIGSCRREMLD